MPHRVHGPRGHRHRHALSSLARAADPATLEDALALVIDDPDDRAFVARCILHEGPAHHRAASWALVAMASVVADRLGARPRRRPDPDAVPIPLRLPPHLAPHPVGHGGPDEGDATFPLRLPLGPLREVAGDERDVEALADALSDGPPHHALANVALVALFDRILEAIEAGGPIRR